MTNGSGRESRLPVDFDLCLPRFAVGRVVATPGALALLDRNGVNVLMLLARHQSGDWGDIPPEDAAENEFAVINGLRVLSSYWLSPT